MVYGLCLYDLCGVRGLLFDVVWFVVVWFVAVCDVLCGVVLFVLCSCAPILCVCVLFVFC